MFMWPPDSTKMRLSKGFSKILWGGPLEAVVWDRVTLIASRMQFDPDCSEITTIKTSWKQIIKVILSIHTNIAI